MISIIIPTYNRAKTIKRAIDSCIAQTYNDIEIIVIDDCSSDQTEEIIKNYKDERIKYYKLEKNSGACTARNKGIELAKGEYIAFQDSDDSWQSTKLEKQLANIKKQKSDVDFTMIKVIGEIEGKENLKPTKEDLKRINKHGIHTALCYQNFISTQSVIGKSECFKNILFDENLPRLQDYDLMLRISKQYKVSITKEPLSNLFVQEDSISKNNNKLISACKIMLEKDYGLDKNSKKIFEASIEKILGDCYREIDKKKSKEYYIESLNNRFNLKVFIKSKL